MASPIFRCASALTAIATGAVLLQGCPAGGTLDDAEAILAARSDGGAGNAGDGGTTEPEEACDDIETLFAGCGSSSCHQEEDGKLGGGTDLLTGDLSRLIDAPATYLEVSDPEACPETPEFIIDSAVPENSLLVRKLRGTMSCGDGMPVPFSLAPWPEEKIVCVESWIKELLAEQDGGGAAAETTP